MRTCTLVLVSAALVGVMAAGTVVRAELKKGKITGHDLMVPITVDSAKLANGMTVRHTNQKGFTTGNEPGNPFDGACQDCFFSDVLAADGSVVSSTAHCQGVDRDGDTWSVVTGAKEGTWVFVGGTGKFKGIEGGGTYKIDKEWPDGRALGSWEGSIK